MDYRGQRKTPSVTPNKGIELTTYSRSSHHALDPFLSIVIFIS